MVVRRGVPLAPLTTLGLGGPAAAFVDAETEEQALAALQDAGREGESVLVLGGGSNVVFSDDGFPGLVVRLSFGGVRIEPLGDDAVLTIAAGEPWDDVVALAIDAKLAGIEALAGIPGRAGATPIQNVGAYGQEIADTLVDVRAYDRATGSVVVLSRDACGFRYRHSVFKGGSRYVLLSLRLRLRRSEESAPVRYAELARALGVATNDRAPLAVVRDTVLALRRSKGMVVDPGDPESRSVGSFFTNPIVRADDVERVAAMLRAAGRLGAEEAVPTFAVDHAFRKIPAAWLVERAGFSRGYGGGAVGVSRKHALALVHRGGGTSRELVALARAIRDGVRAATGITLEPEPVLVGVTLA